MIIYKWGIEHLNCYAEKNGKKNVAYGVDFKVTGTSDKTKDDGTPYFVERFDFIDLPEMKDDAYFLEFEKLTPNKVITWVKSVLGERGVKHIEGIIADSIDSISRPVIKKVKLKLKNNTTTP
tara:strand:- start:565 stop:930 length:366 start_codon:yes stop_codon:yes gene_type:complete